MSYPTYESYKESGLEWLGKFPSGWDIKKVTHSIKYFVGFTPESGNELYYGEGFYWANISDLGEKFLSKTESQITSFAIETYNKEIVKSGSLLYSFKLSVGLVSITKEDMFTNEAVAAFQPGQNLHLPYMYYMAPETIIHNASENIYGAKILNQEAIGNAKLIIPPFEEQKTIAAFLDEKTAAIDALITEKEALLEQLAEKRAALITQAVTKGLDPAAQMKSSGIDWLGDVPEAWTITPLRYLGTLQNGISFSSEKYGYGSPFVSYGDVYRGFELPRNVKGQLKTSKKEQNAYSVIQGDVFFTRTSETIEEIAISSVCISSIIDATFAGFLIRFRPYKNKLHPNFSKFYFRNQDTRKYFVKEMNLVTRASLNQDLLGGLSVLLPPYSEQKDIGEFLNIQCSKIDEVIKSTSQSIDKYKEYRASLITNAVTGKIKVI